MTRSTAHRTEMRSADRPKKSDEGAKRRGEGGTEKMLSVTVPIVAGPKESATAARHQGRRRALYRAKQSGRNRGSR